MNKVSINIPTYNSEKTLELCLDNIKKQTYKNIEIIVIDGGSEDKTLDIAKSYGAKVFIYKKALLGARDLGVKKSGGEYVLLLDSDQILEKDCLERAVSEMDKFDILALEEKVYRANNWIEKLFQADRRLIHKVKDFSPYTGVILPRFYKKDLLLKALNRIPSGIKENVGGQDHAIIYFEVWELSRKVGLINNTVMHIEPNSLKAIWNKFYRWGYTSYNARIGKYEQMLNKKERFRTGTFTKGLSMDGFSSILLLILKGVPYKFGYFRAKIKNG